MSEGPGPGAPAPSGAAGVAGPALPSWPRSVAALLLVVAVAVAVPALMLARRRSERAAALPRYGTVPTFALPHHGGGTLTAADLVGAPWIADFIFTSCVESCPMLTTRMKALDRALHEQGGAAGARVKLVSFSVDPATDTPERLAEYAAKWVARPPTWTFVSGTTDSIQRVVREGFKLGVDPRMGGGPTDIVHSNRFVLVDGSGVIRGYYDAEDEQARSALVKDALRLSEAPARGE